MIKLKVLQILPGLESGGVERGTVELVRALVKAKHSAFVCSSGGNLVKNVTNAAGIHFTLPVHSKNPITMIRNIFRIRDLIESNGINIVHARSRAPAWSAYFACRLANCKFVTTFHGTYGTEGALKRFYNSIMLKGDKVIAISNFILKHVETYYRYIKDNAEVIHRGVDLEYFNTENVNKKRIDDLKDWLALPDESLFDRTVIVLPARFVRWKGHLFLLKALKYLKKKSFTCLLVGAVSPEHYEYKEEVEAKIKEYELDDCVFLRNNASDMPAFYKIADIVISSSSPKPEAFGRTVVEGQAMGKTVIATAHGGPLETIDNGKTGFLISPTDPSALTDAITEVMKKDKKAKDKIIKAAQKSVKTNFSVESMCKKIIALYKELLT